MNMLPKEPKAVLNACCAKGAAVSPVDTELVDIITKAVIVSTINVSINTPIMATIPWSHGWSTFALAWA